MKLLEGKVALITGAARGIGKAIAIKFAKEGAQIAFTDLNYDDNMKATEAELSALGVKAKGYASNAASFEDSEKLIENVTNDFEKIDILVNNAGITRDNLLMRMQESDWDIVMTVNLKSVFNLTKAVQRVMMKQRYGSIVNMSSVVGVEGNAGQSNYSASKAGMIGFTKSIAQELGSRNIRCNAIAPGFIETEMTHQLKEDVREAWIKTIPLRRSGKPEDVADVAAYLASDMSSYVTGQVINVCGGMST
ncbi:MAG: 3-oxoacyl-[acyl-carrier-protein] reductase [Bacteroidetes bacterium]|nr:3-oxoacyl-[acyl-carrier-protein] reductase [Bacteroidota bacterium]